MAGPSGGKVEAAFGADLTADPLAMTWTDLTPRVQMPSLVISRGFRSDGSQVAEPSATSFDLENDNGDFTPHKATSTYYPNVRDGVPVRASWSFGDRYLSVTGAANGRASTPDTAALDITGDISGAVQFRCPVRVPTGSAYEVCGKNVNSGNQRSYLLHLNSDGTARWRWSTNGTAELEARTSRPIPRPDAGPLTLGWFLDVSVGGNNVTTWYLVKGTIDDLLADLAGNVFGDPYTISGTTSIFNSTAPFEIGDVVGAGFLPFRGGIDRVQLRSGDLSTGTIAFDADFRTQTAGAGSFTEATGKTVTITAPASISDRKYRIVGQLASNRPEWPSKGAEGTARVNWQVAGILRRLRNNDDALESALYRSITAPSNADVVKAFWPLEDGRTATSFASPIPGVQPMIFGGDLKPASNDDYVASKPRASVPGDRPYGWAGTVPPYSGTASRVDIYYEIPTAEPSPAFTPLLVVGGTGTVARWVVEVNDTNVRVTGADSVGATVTTNTTTVPSVTYGTKLLVSLHITQNGGNVDWIVSFIDTSTGLGSSPIGSYAGTVGIVSSVSNLFSTAPPDGFAVGPIVVTSGTALGWLAGGDSAFVGEPAGSRVFRLCREQGIPVLVDGIYGTAWAEAVTAGAVPMGPQRPIPLLDLLEECATTDEGLVGDSRELFAVAYRSGTTRLNQPAKITLGNEITDLAPVADDQRLVNDATVSSVDGTFARHVAPEVDTDPTVDRHRGSKEANPDDPARLGDLASWWVHRSTWPELRYPDVPAELAKNTALFDDWHDVNPGDRLDGTGLPDEHPTSTLTQLVDGWREEISPFLWSIAPNTSPAGPWDVGVLDSTTHRVDTDGSELHAAVNSSATTLDVAVTAGPPWTADNALDGFDIAVGGELMTVTDIADVAVTFGAVGTAAHAVNADVTPGLPAGTTEGDLLLVLAAIRGGIPFTPTGYVRLDAFSSGSGVHVYAKIAGASESAPTISFGGGTANSDTSAQMARFAGDFHDVNNLLVAHNDIASGSNQDIPYPATHVPYDNCLILYLGWKADDWTSVATIGGATELGEPDTTAGDDQGIVWDYVIQTTKADIASGSFVVTGGVAAISRGAVVALRCDRQTFTVTRSTNGVVKSQTAGTAVNPAFPLRTSI